MYSKASYPSKVCPRALPAVVGACALGLAGLMYGGPGRAQTAPYIAEGLPRGNHTITIEVTGTKNESAGGAWVWLDAFDVIQ